MLEALYRAIRGDVKTEIIEVDGRKYSTGSLHKVTEPIPSSIELNTLTGLVDFIKDAGDVEAKNLICHIESPSKVHLYSKLFGDFAQRKKYLFITALPLDIRFEHFLSSEKMNIMLQSCFVSDPEQHHENYKVTDKGLLLKYTANITHTVEAGIDDDGTSQAVSMRSGISSKTNVVLPNPVTLRPYRTFSEVEQPASQFVFRVNKDLEFGLFEADGGVWKNEAMLSIKAYLEKEVPDLTVLA